MFALWPHGTTPTSVAVLPFVNATEDPELDYLSEGITDGLSNSLLAHRRSPRRSADARVPLRRRADRRRDDRPHARG